MSKVILIDLLMQRGMVKKHCDWNIGPLYHAFTLRFGGHVDIEISYKILRLEVQKESPILDTSPCFQ
jgi:hypothetical protein